MVAQIHRPAVTNYHGRQSYTVGDNANVISNGHIDVQLVKLTTVAVKMATVGLLSPDALIYSITYNARIHNLIHSVCVVRFPMPLATLKSIKNLVFFA